MSHHGILSTNQRLPLFLTFCPSPLTASVIHRPETPHLPTMRRPFGCLGTLRLRAMFVSTFLKAVALISSPRSQRYRSVEAGAKMCDVAPDRGADHLGAHRGGLRTCRVACEPMRERAFFIEDSNNADSDRAGSAKARHGPPTSVSDPFTALVSTLRGKPCKRRGQPAQTRIRTLRSEPAVSLAPRRRGPGRTPDPHRVIV